MKLLSKLLLASLLISVLSFSACTPAITPSEPESNFPSEEEVTEDKPTIPTPVIIDYDAAEKSLSLEGTNYIQTPTDTYGDKSTFNRIRGSSSFNVATEVILTYKPEENLKNDPIPITIIDLTNDETVYTGPLLNGTHPYKVLLEADHAGFAPRLHVCFQGEKCTQLRANNVENAFSTNIESFPVNIEREEVTKPIIVTNDGNTFLTIFSQIPSNTDFKIEVDKEIITLEPDSKTIINFAVSGTKSIGEEIVTLYALADSCSVSEECAQSAKLKQEIEIKFN